MDSRNRNRFPPRQDNTNKKSSPYTNSQVPGARTYESPYSQYYSNQTRTKLEAERLSRIMAKSAAARKMEEMRMKNYVEQYVNMVKFSAELSRLRYEEKAKWNERKRMEKERTTRPENFVFISEENRGLRYKARKTFGKNNIPFQVDIDVKGCNPRNIQIDSEENKITVKAIMFGGQVKILGIVCPTTEDVERIRIHVPKNGNLLIEGPDSD